MKFIVFIILLSFSFLGEARSYTNPALTVNRFFQTGNFKIDAEFQTVVAPSLATPHNYYSFECTTTMTNPLLPITKVYYSTAQA